MGVFSALSLPSPFVERDLTKPRSRSIGLWDKRFNPAEYPFDQCRLLSAEGVICPDERSIHNVVDKWLRATATGGLNSMLSVSAIFCELSAQFLSGSKQSVLRRALGRLEDACYSSQFQSVIMPQLEHHALAR